MLTYYRTDFGPVSIKEKPDIIQIESPAIFGLSRQFPGLPIVFDEHNFWWQMEQHNIQAGPTLKRLPFKRIFAKWFLSRAKVFELDALKKSAHVIVCSKVDKGEMLKELPQIADKISYIPNCLDVNRYQAGKNNSRVVLFMGSLVYHPNIEAVRIICQELAPRVDAEFHILGQGPIDFKVPANVKIVGWVPDNRSYIRQARICIVPLRHGSGTRVKILEFMATGKAVISTSKGAEGLEATPNEDIIIEDDMEKFADEINRFLKDDGLCSKLGSAGRRLIEEKYDYRKYCEPLKSIYDSI